MGDVADTGQCFATKTIGPDCVQVLKCLKLGGCKPFAENGKIISLEEKFSRGCSLRWQAAEHTLMPCPLSVICNSFKPPSLARISMLVEPASTAFSINSFKAWTGATIISPAAILLITSWSRAHKECQRGQNVGKVLALYLDPFGSLSSNELRAVGRTLGASRAVARGFHGICHKLWLE